MDLEDTVIADTARISKEQLCSYVERIERLEEEKANVMLEIKDVYNEAKSSGFDPKILKKVVSLRKQDVSERQEEEAILDLYLQTLGML